ncbi:MAG: DUF1549 domain-containing protein [Pirellulaceae bacterium]|jgi:hypothetical protein|nr:DUF1549 domain-containing protein [Pirellulaceae bacterium]MDP7016395.1 DUF1549 domain-containing protein [Pirellulaceae bacterium]
MHALLLMVAAVTSADSVDSILADEWTRRGLTPAEVCSDEQFLRRVSLDLIGRIPTVAELQEFRRQPDRAAKVDALLASDEFPRFWSETWTAALNGYSNAFQSDREVLRQWWEQSVRDETPYDEQVTKLIAARGVSALDGPVNFLVRYPQQPAVKAARLFLGVRLDCARCHDHPFDRWTKEDFEMFNRFFSATERREVAQGNIRLLNRRARVEPRERPRFLTGARPRTTQWRDELALFMTNSKPFARAYANRLWYHFLGRGIVEPVDDFNRDNRPSVPALMTHLTEEVRRRRFALKPMIRQICNSRAYQLSSHSPRAGEQDVADLEEVFAVRTLKPLTPEQTYDSVRAALGLARNDDERRRFIRRAVGQSLDEDFSITWQYRETVQSLMARLNINTPAPTSRIDGLYLRILSRSPTDRERRLCAKQSPRDIAFALVNSNEFCFNH